MRGSIFIFTLMIAAAASANARDLQFKNFEVRDDQNVWTYSVTCPKPDTKLDVLLEIPRSAYVKMATSKKGYPIKRQEKVTTTTKESQKQEKVTTTIEDSRKHETVTTTTKDSLHESAVAPGTQYSMRQSRKKCGTLEIEFALLDTANRTITFEVIAPKRVTKNGEIEWTICPKVAAIAPCSGTAPGPVGIDDPIVRPVLAIGGIWRDDEFIDFKFENKAVLIKHKPENRLRPSLSAGFLLNCFNWDCKYIQALDLLLSFEFGVDSEKVIDGFVCGLGFRVKRKFDFFIGVSMRTERELRPGFMKVAKQLSDDIETGGMDSLLVLDTEDNDINPKVIKWNFDRFMDLNDLENFDGFPTFDPRDEMPIFYGDPLINHTKWTMAFGLAVPLDIGNWIPD